MTGVVLADPMPGVRAGLRWLLAGSAVEVVAEAGTAAEALAAPGDVVVCGLGLAAAVCAGARPVVVYTWLPPDERDVELPAAVAVLRTGTLRATLVPAIQSAADHPRARRRA